MPTRSSGSVCKLFADCASQVLLSVSSGLMPYLQYFTDHRFFPMQSRMALFAVLHGVQFCHCPDLVVSLVSVVRHDFLQFPPVSGQFTLSVRTKKRRFFFSTSGNFDLKKKKIFGHKDQELHFRCAPHFDFRWGR